MRALSFLSVMATASASLMELLHDVPDGWQKVGIPFPEEHLLLRIAMTSPAIGLFEQTLYEVSDPKSSRYGKHMKRDELKHMLRPTSEGTTSVINWLLQGGISMDGIADDGEWINFVASVWQAETLLNTTFALYQNRRGMKKVRTLEYSVPDELHNYIDMIQPTTRFGDMQAERSLVLDYHVAGQAPYYKEHYYSRLNDLSTGAALQDCGSSVTPACLRALYKLPDPSTLQIDNETAGYMAFPNFLEQYPRYRDLWEFQQEYAPYALGSNFTWESVAGGLLDQNSQEDSIEGNLDVQYLQSIGWPVSTNTYSTAGRGPLVTDLSQPDPNDSTNEPYLEYLNFMLAKPDGQLPHTLTFSYGENEQSVPLQYRKTVCNMLGQLGARGVSVLFSSGDTGVGSGCLTNDGRNQTRFLPIFPGSCPYVTAVGGTTGVSPERAVGFSSGGFSDTWTRPAYQDAAVLPYLQSLGNTWRGLYNPMGRAIPDVAAQAYQFHVVDKGNDTFVSGTSAAAPVFAGIIALFNAQRIQAGKAPMGFLNPFIYSQGYQGLVDITTGGSNGCTGVDQYSNLPTPFIPGAAWNATVGWDPVTGFGTPDYEKLLPLAMACAPGTPHLGGH